MRYDGKISDIFIETEFGYVKCCLEKWICGIFFLSSYGILIKIIRTKTCIIKMYIISR